MTELVRTSRLVKGYLKTQMKDEKFKEMQNGIKKLTVEAYEDSGKDSSESEKETGEQKLSLLAQSTIRAQTLQMKQ